MADRRIIKENGGYWLPKKSLKPSILDFPDPPPRPAGPKTTLGRIADALRQSPGLLLVLSQINQHQKRILIMNKRKKREESPDGGGIRRFFSTVWYALTDGGF